MMNYIDITWKMLILLLKITKIKYNDYEKDLFCGFRIGNEY